MSLDRDIGEMLARISALEAHNAKIDARLDAGDKRFEAAAVREAGEDATARLALRVGSAAIGAAGMLGLYLLSFVPGLVTWWATVASSKH